MRNALIIFIKNPVEGNVKTRLAETMGNKLALKIYNALLQHTNFVVKNVNADKYLFYSSFINQNDEWENDLFVKQLQSGDDLGIRMLHAFETVFAVGYKKVCIIGSDCLEITPAIIHQSFISLNNTDVVIGPAKDGGYYLLSIKKMYAEIFKNISWSTPYVLNETISICEQLNLTYLLLPQLTDIDVEKDLDEFKPGYF